MNREFKISVLVILCVTLLLTIKDCNLKRNFSLAQERNEKKENSEKHTRDSFFKINGPAIQSIEDNINICYSHLDNIQLKPYSTIDDALPDLIAYKVNDNKDSLSHLKGHWPYQQTNTIALSFDPDNLNAFHLIEYMKQLKSDNQEYALSNSAFDLLSNPGNYIELTNRLKNSQYVAFIIKDRSISPSIEDKGYNTGAYHYRISIFDLQTHKLIDSKEAMAINSDIEVRSQFELIINLRENARKALYRTLYRTII